MRYTSVTFRDLLDGEKLRSDYTIVFFEQLVIKMPQIEFVEQTQEMVQSEFACSSCKP